MAQMTLRQLSDKLQAFNEELVADVVIKNNEPLAVRLNQKQLVDGETPKDTPITPSYKSPSYALFKNRKNSRPGLGTPDVRVTGALHAGIRLMKSGDLYNMGNINEKAKFETITQYGDLWGLQKQNELTFRNKNNRDFIEELKKQTGL